MGSRGEGFAGNALFGSNVSKVLNNLNRPVFIIPQNARFKDIEKLPTQQTFEVLS